MSRHRKVQLSRSKAILVAAGALSVATAAPATAATWTSGPAATTTQAGTAQAGTAQAGTAQAAVQTPAAIAFPTPSPTAARPPTPSPTPTAPTASGSGSGSGSPQQIAQAMLGSFGWSASQFSCLNPLWTRESSWRVTAYNASSGAYGIPQALPGSKMASAGPDWQRNATTQIKWGLRYIKVTYGSPCAAYSHQQATGWY